MHYIDFSDIHEPTLCVWSLPLLEVLCYSDSNKVTWQWCSISVTHTYLSKAGCINRLQLLPGTEVKVVVIDGATRKTDTFLVVVVALQPDGRLKNTSLVTISWVVSSCNKDAQVCYHGDGYQNMQNYKEGFPDTNLKPCRKLFGRYMYFDWRF